MTNPPTASNPRKPQSLNIWDVLNESGTDDTECLRKAASGRKVAGAIRSLVNARSLQF